MNKISHYIMVAEVKNQQKLTRANSLKKKEKNTKASLDHAAARVVKRKFTDCMFDPIIISQLFFDDQIAHTKATIFLGLARR